MNQGRILYHFTSNLHVNRCLKEGLTKGVTFTGEGKTGGLALLKKTQWLTLNPDFKQEWNENSTLSYDRTANRFKILIPHKSTANLVPWTTFGPLMAPKTFGMLSMYGDFDNWYIYLGVIPPEWIIEHVKKSSLQESKNGQKK